MLPFLLGCGRTTKPRLTRTLRMCASTSPPWSSRDTTDAVNLHGRKRGRLTIGDCSATLARNWPRPIKRYRMYWERWLANSQSSGIDRVRSRCHPTFQQPASCQGFLKGPWSIALPLGKPEPGEGNSGHSNLARAHWYRMLECKQWEGTYFTLPILVYGLLKHIYIYIYIH